MSDLKVEKGKHIIQTHGTSERYFTIFRKVRGKKCYMHKTKVKSYPQGLFKALTFSI